LSRLKPAFFDFVVLQDRQQFIAALPEMDIPPQRCTPFLLALPVENKSPHDRHVASRPVLAFGWGEAQGRKASRLPNFDVTVDLRGHLLSFSVDESPHRTRSN